MAHKVYVKVQVTFKDGKRNTFNCSDTPTLGGDWVVIYPLSDPMGRKQLRTELIDEINWSYKTSNKKVDDVMKGQKQSKMGFSK